MQCRERSAISIVILVVRLAGRFVKKNTSNDTSDILGLLEDKVCTGGTGWIGELVYVGRSGVDCWRQLYVVRLKNSPLHLLSYTLSRTVSNHRSSSPYPNNAQAYTVGSVN